MVTERLQKKKNMKTLVAILALSLTCCAQTTKKPKERAVKIAGKTECKPPDPKDPYGEFNNNLTVNGTAYKCSPEGQWIVDEEAMKRKAQWEKAKDDLYWALRTRVLTVDEMERVRELGISLVTREWTPYHEADKQRELNDALLLQFRLKLEAERAGKCGGK